MAGKAVWEYRGDPERSAVLVHFTNGTIQNPEGVNFTLYKNKDDKTMRTKRQRIMTADTDRLSYVGNNYSPEAMMSNSLCKYFVGVLHKETGKMDVYDAEHINMQPILESNMDEQNVDVPDQSNRTYREKVDALIEAFGTNKQKRALSSRRLNQVGNELLSKAMEKAAEKIIETKGKTELRKEAMVKPEEESPSLFLPPCDANANKPEDIYKFDDLIPPVQYEALESVSAAFKNITLEELQSMTEKKEHSCYVMQELRELRLAKDIDRQARALWYLDILMKVSNLKVVKRKDIISSGCPDIICGYLIKNFTVTMYKNGRVQNTISATMKSKIVAYAIALALHISEFQVDLACLKKDFKLTENRITEISKAMGLKIAKKVMNSESSLEKGHKTATLQLPLIVYKPGGGMKRKKKM